MNMQKINKNHTSYTHYTDLLGVSNVAKCNVWHALTNHDKQDKKKKKFQPYLVLFPAS